MDDIEPSAIEPNDPAEADATDAIDAIGFRAGRALRRPAPSDGLASIERASSRRHVARTAIAVAVGVSVVAIAAVVVGTGRSAVEPTSPIRIDPSVTELDLPTPTPPNESIAAAPPTTPATLAATPTTDTESTQPAGTEPSIETTTPIVGHLRDLERSAGLIVESPIEAVCCPSVMPAISGTVIAQSPTSSSGAALSDDGTVLGLLAENAALQTFDVATMAPLATLRCPQPGEPLDTVWDQQHRAMLARATAMVDANPGAALMRTDDPIQPGCRLAFSLDGTRVAVSDPADDVTILFDARDGAELARINGTRPVFSPREFSIRPLLVVGGAGAATVWDGATGRQLGTLDSDGDGQANVAATFSPDGAMIATLNVATPNVAMPNGAWNVGSLIFWDAVTLERLWSTGGGRSYSFRGTDGPQVAVASVEGATDGRTFNLVQLIDTRSWQGSEIQTIFDTPVGVALDPLRRFVYFVGVSSNLLLDFQYLQTRRDFGPRGIWMAAFSADGTRLVLSGPSGTVVVNSSSP